MGIVLSIWRVIFVDIVPTIIAISITTTFSITAALGTINTCRLWKRMMSSFDSNRAVFFLPL
jgi:hypothetical protein